MRPTPRCWAPLECMVHSLVRQSTRHVVPAPTVQAVWRLVDPRVCVVWSRIRVVPRDKILHTTVITATRYMSARSVRLHKSINCSASTIYSRVRPQHNYPAVVWPVSERETHRKRNRQTDRQTLCLCVRERV